MGSTLSMRLGSTIKLDHCIRVITGAITEPTTAPSCEEKLPLNKSLFLQFRCQMKGWTKSLSSSQLETFIHTNKTQFNIVLCNYKQGY